MKEEKKLSTFAAIECLRAVREFASQRGDMCYDVAAEKNQSPRVKDFLIGKTDAYYDIADNISELITTLEGGKSA